MAHDISPPAVEVDVPTIAVHVKCAKCNHEFKNTEFEIEEGPDYKGRYEIEVIPYPCPVCIEEAEEDARNEYED